MQTSLTETLRATTDGRYADAILRSCIHCGFCNATCPSAVRYGELRDIGRAYIERHTPLAASHCGTLAAAAHSDITSMPSPKRTCICAMRVPVRHWIELLG